LTHGKVGEELVKKIRLMVAIGLIMALLLSACEELPFDVPWLTDESPTPTLPAGEISELTPTPEEMPDVVPTPEPVTSLTVWVPPEMNPDADTAASRLFIERLETFSSLYDGLDINVRVKAASGMGGLLDSLTATSAAAPDVLPDLIALSRPDLETAALKGVIFPLDGMTEVPDDTDWYAFARDMALVQVSTFGLPFAADSLVFVYRPGEIHDFPTNWARLLEEGIVLAFPAESDQALFPLALYLAEDGAVKDTQRRPMLQVGPLSAIFSLFEEGHISGTFPGWLNQYQTMGQVWTDFREGETDLVVTWLSNYLKENPADAIMRPLFPTSNEAVSVGTGMSWAVATPEPERQNVAIALAEYLVQPDYLSEWTMEAGYMPPRPSSLEGWRGQILRTTVSQVALMTQLRPSNEVISSIGPILREGVRQVLQDQLGPAQAAREAVESLEED